MYKDTRSNCVVEHVSSRSPEEMPQKNCQPKTGRVKEYTDKGMKRESMGVRRELGIRRKPRWGLRPQAPSGFAARM